MYVGTSFLIFQMLNLPRIKKDEKQGKCWKGIAFSVIYCGTICHRFLYLCHFFMAIKNLDNTPSSVASLLLSHSYGRYKKFPHLVNEKEH